MRRGKVRIGVILPPLFFGRRFGRGCEGPNTQPMISAVLLALLIGSGYSAEWPAARGGPDHTGVAGEVLQTPLELAWQYQSNHPPQPAFRGHLAPSRGIERVEPMTYDYVFEPIVAGGRLFCGSSSEDAVYCLDATTGVVIWTFHAEGPIRFAPCVVGGRLYFGSDDGCVHCLDAAGGSLIWRLRAGPSNRRCIGNGRVISAWPVRTSVAVAGGVLYFGAGLLPPMGTYLGAADADSGKLLWRRPIPYSPHGNIVIEKDTLFVATGRTASSPSTGRRFAARRWRTRRSSGTGGKRRRTLDTAPGHLGWGGPASSFPKTACWPTRSTKRRRGRRPIRRT